MSLRTHARGVAATSIIAFALIVPPVSAIADTPSPYGVLAQALTQGIENGRFGITASLHGEMRGHEFDLPGGRVSLQVDMVKGRGSFEGNVDLGSIAPIRPEVTDLHAARDGKLKWDIRWDQRGVRVKAKGFDFLVEGAPGFTPSSAPDGWMGINGNQLDALIAKLGEVAAPMGIMADLPIDGPWAQAAFNAAGLTASWGTQTAQEAKGEYNVVVDLDPAILQDAISSFGGPVVLTSGGSRFMTARDARAVKSQALGALEDTDQLRIELRVNKGSRQVAELKVHFRGTIDGQRANIELKLQFKAQNVDAQIMPLGVESLSPLYSVAMCVLDGGTIDGCAAG